VITLGYFRRHQQTLRGADDVVLLDVAQEYVLEHLRRRHARDLYDLEHLARVMQTAGVVADICDLAAVKIYADVVEEDIESRPLTNPAAVFGCAPADVRGAEDLGTFRASETDVQQLLASCRQRYAPLTALAERSPQIAGVAARCSRGDLRQVMHVRQTLVDRLSGVSL